MSPTIPYAYHKSPNSNARTSISVCSSHRSILSPWSKSFEEAVHLSKIQVYYMSTQEKAEITYFAHQPCTMQASNACSG